MIVTCQAGFQDLLAGELAALGHAVAEEGPGWVRLEPAGRASPAAEGTPTPVAAGDWAFAHVTLTDAREIKGSSVNALAQGLVEAMLAAVRGERIESAWPCVFHCPAEIVGLGRRVASVERAFHELLRKRLSRVSKLAVSDLPRALGEHRGWMVYFVDFDRAFAARVLQIHGPRRMADDDRAPSRSYLKVEEAYVLAGREPQPGETVVDLGAAPGGWSYSAAKRGAQVLALDNGPLKGGALGHPQIEHRRVDAFGFQPEPGQCFDWLFCDLVEDPHHVLSNLVEPWLSRHWCRRFIVNLKFGRVAPQAFLAEVRSPQGVFARYAPGFRVSHLYHDREELTVVGEVKP
jgi:23S rRNA (cytidine2498-2'-O)-methyltransferase